MSWPRRAGRAGRIVAQYARQVVTGRLITVAMRDISDEFAFSLSDTGWHPLTALLADVDRGVGVDATSYTAFFSAPAVRQVGTLNDVLFLHAPERAAALPRFWLGTYPWGGLVAGDVLGTPFGWAFDEATASTTAERWGRHRTPWYRPGHGPTITVDTDRTLELYSSVRSSGYSPWRARGWPSVCLLERNDGERRALIIDGHHRLSVLAHLGARTTRVEVGHLVRERDIATWPAVRDRRCGIDQARCIFSAFFALDGRERFDAVCAAPRSEPR